MAVAGTLPKTAARPRSSCRFEPCGHCVNAALEVCDIVLGPIEQFMSLSETGHAGFESRQSPISDSVRVDQAPVDRPVPLLLRR